MSADNYIVIRKDAGGQYVPCMGFASCQRSDWNDDDPTYPEIQPHDRRYDTLSEALAASWDVYTEYGVSAHPECEVPDVAAIARFDYEHGGWRFRSADGNRQQGDELVVVNEWWLNRYLDTVERLEAMEGELVRQASLNPRRPYTLDRQPSGNVK